MKNQVFPERNKINNFMCGLAAGSAEAVSVVTPQETLKTKLIHDMLSPQPQYRNIFNGIYSILAQKGFMGVYMGVVPTILKQSTN